MEEKPFLRYIYKSDEDLNEWQEIVEDFPNKIPRFQSKIDCENWIKKYSGYHTNPDYPELTHSITTLISWEQIENYVLPKLREFEKLSRIHVKDLIIDNNRFIQTEIDEGPGSYPEGSLAIKEAVESRLNLGIHRTLTRYSTENTLRYAFYHMRCGIIVSIRCNEVVLFCPFVNKDFTNTWSDRLQVEGGTVETYISTKRRFYREENILDKNKWWANGNIICAEHTQPGEETTQWWGDHFLLQLRDMFAETCANREIPDCDFFINKRDYPQLKYNLNLHRPVEPYGFIFDCDDRDPNQDILLSDNEYNSYAPFMSFYSSSRFTDLMIPTSEDWEAATGEVFPSTLSWNPSSGNDVPKIRDLFTSTNLKKFDVPWENKRNLAFFRGTATGGGVTIETNQRLHISQLCYEWEQEGSALKGYLDAGIVGWNMRDKKIAASPMTFVRSRNFPFKKLEFTPIYEQSTYKYLLYIEGHCAACRYGFMMCLGSVILKVDSLCVADEMWYFPLLRPYYDHVPVKSDFSDLQEKIEWCRQNDDKCREIATNARLLHDRYISREGILDYLQLLTVEIAKRTFTAVECFSDAPERLSIPQDVTLSNRQSCCTINGSDELCVTCRLRKEKQDIKLQMIEKGRKNDLEHRAARDRFKKRARMMNESKNT